MIGHPFANLKNLIMTEEDYRDIREIQPFVLPEDQLWIYERKFRGEERMDDVDCWVLQVRPRQILQGQRLFDGMIWADKKTFSIVRMEGQAVPQIRTMKSENLFPRFDYAAASGRRRSLVPAEDVCGRYDISAAGEADPADHPLQQLQKVRRRIHGHVRQVRPFPPACSGRQCTRHRFGLAHTGK